MSADPWLLIADNCEGHEATMQFPGVRIEFLPARTTAKYQPLDLGLTANCKIRYHSLFLRAPYNVTLVSDLVIGRPDFPGSPVSCCRIT